MNIYEYKYRLEEKARNSVGGGKSWRFDNKTAKTLGRTVCSFPVTALADLRGPPRELKLVRFDLILIKKIEGMN